MQEHISLHDRATNKASELTPEGLISVVLKVSIIDGAQAIHKRLVLEYSLDHAQTSTAEGDLC